MFVHLHNHFSGSYSDSLLRINEGVQRFAEFGMPAAAITDHGDLSFIIDFYNTCKRYGVKPVIGCECYFVEDAQKSIEEKNAYRNHLVLLARDNDGLRNLIALNNESWLENCFYGQRGLADWRLLEKYHRGLIALTACYWGAVSRKYVCNGFDEARSAYARYYDIFGDDFYPEVGRHGVADEELSNEVLEKLAGIFGSKPVLTNDVHYLNQEYWIVHDILIKTRHGFASNFKIDAQNFYLKSTEAMARLGFPPAYMESTLEIAEKCNIDLDTYDWGAPGGDEQQYIRAPKLSIINARSAIEATASAMKVDAGQLLGVLPDGQTLDAALENTAFREKAEAFPTLLSFARIIEGIPRRAEADPEWLVKVDGEFTIPIRISHGAITSQFTKEIMREIGLAVEKSSTIPSCIKESRKLQALERADELRRYRKYGEARKAILELYNREPENVEYIYAIAGTYYSEGSYSDAINWFKSALEAKGSKSLVPEISVRIGWCFSRLDDRESSIKWFKAALASKPRFPQALYGLGIVHFLNNQYREGGKFLKDFIDTNPPERKREKAEKILATIERRTAQRSH